MSLHHSLPSSLELINLTSDITIEDLIRKHESFMSNGGCLQSNQLIEIFGGADAILSHYLSTNNLSPLTSQQLLQINSLFSLSTDKLNDGYPINEDDKTLASPSLLASNSNTFLHQMTSKDIANKIVSGIYNPITTILVGIGWLIVAVITGFSLIKYYYVYCFLLFLLSILMIHIFLLLLVLSKQIANLTIQTFEFWFKMIYLIRFSIGEYVAIVICPEWNFHTPPGVGPHTVLVFQTIFVMQIGLLFCLLDGLKMPLRMKITLLILLTIALGGRAFIYTFLVDDTCSASFFGSYTLDLVELGAASLRIWAIFACKQTFYSIFKQPKSAIINKSVSISWI